MASFKLAAAVLLGASATCAWTTRTSFAPTSIQLPSPLCARPYETHDDAPGPLASAVVPGVDRRPATASRLRSALRRARPVALGLLAASALTGPRGGGGAPPAWASAPIVLRPSMKKKEPPLVRARNQAAESKKKRSMEEFDSFMARANDVEKREGKAAREAYEKQYHADKARKGAQKVIDVETLKRELLDKGQDPFTELDAEREVFLLEHDVDLNKVIGTRQSELVAKNFLKKGKQMRKGVKVTEIPSSTEDQRYVVACQVADLKARGVDPLEHFAQYEVREKTRGIYRMSDLASERVANQYKTLMRRAGRLSPPAEGEIPFVHAPRMVEEIVEDIAATPKVSPAEARRAKAGLRTAEKEAARQARHAARAEKKAHKLAAKTKKVAGREARKAREGAALQVEEAAGFEAGAVAPARVYNDGAPFVVPPLEDQAAKATATTAVSSAAARQSPSYKAGGVVAQLKAVATPRNGVAVLAGGGAVAYGVNYLRENGGAAQKERERQFRLILGDDEEEDDEDEDDGDYKQFTQQEKSRPQTTLNADESSPAPKAATPRPPTPPVAVPPKPKRLGIFSKRNANARETDLAAFVRPDAQHFAFATLLAQLLAAGAPGRFPAVDVWGPAPLNGFDLNAAKALLVTERGKNAALTDNEASAEVFANVVNCMIIDIVDLASSTLKVKNQEEKATVDALNVVMDFMDHAASLFDAVAEEATIKPVTYGGKLRKKELEQMFSMYAGSSIMSMDALTGGDAGGGANQDRVDTLQLVFAITDKKAEGLMQKHTMTMMMNLMKDGGSGLEGLSEMPGMEEMAAMLGGGAEGMPGMPGIHDGEMSMEDIKQTLDVMKDMKDSGQVTEEELVKIRKQFRELYGSDVADLLKKATEEETAGGMTDDEKALLDMFKWILGEE